MSPLQRTATPHTVRYILTLRAALSTEHGTPETVIAVLRASHGILGAGLNGSRCLLKELNLACHNLLLGDETSRLSPAVNRDAGAFSFFTKPLPHPQADDASGGVNASETKFEGAVASPATGTEVVTALYCAAFRPWLVGRTAGAGGVSTNDGAPIPRCSERGFHRSS